MLCCHVIHNVSNYLYSVSWSWLTTPRKRKHRCLIVLGTLLLTILLCPEMLWCRIGDLVTAHKHRTHLWHFGTETKWPQLLKYIHFCKKIFLSWLFPRIQLTVNQNWFEQASSHYLTKCWCSLLTYVCVTWLRWFDKYRTTASLPAAFTVKGVSL